MPYTFHVLANGTYWVGGWRPVTIGEGGGGPKMTIIIN